MNTHSQESKVEKQIQTHRDESTFSFDPEKLTHAKPLERRKSRSGRVIVMRRGAAILSHPRSRKSSQISEDKAKKPQTLTIEPPSIAAPIPSTPDEPPKTCDKENTTSKCNCDCHANNTDQQVDESRPYLRLADEPANKQPSLDDSGVVGDHDCGDSVSMHQQQVIIKNTFQHH